MINKDEEKTIIAFMYDFDNTLTTKDMQEYTFIPMLNMEPKKFWQEANGFGVDNKMDAILAYMYTMLQKAQKQGMPLRREFFEHCGEAIEFFPGVLTWFDRINAYAASKGAKIEHYIISSGLKEFITGSAVGDKFEKIFACEYYYDDDGVAVWPLMTVNYTEKTQYLFRINKGVLNVANHKELNEVTPEDERRIPFSNMVYIGDGMTDIPCMKLVKEYGGKSIAVYPRDDFEKKINAYQLLRDERVNFFEPADYTENSELTDRIKRIVDAVVANDVLLKDNVDQRTMNQVELGSKIKDMVEDYREFKSNVKELHAIRKEMRRNAYKGVREQIKEDLLNEYENLKEIRRKRKEEKKKIK